MLTDIKGEIDNEKKYVKIPDREEAIKYAVANSRPGDVVLLCGKGHEDYQALDFGTIYFDESEIVKELLEKA